MSKRQVPPGDENLICPLHNKYCNKVCSKCPWWVSLRGKNPNTGEDINEWMCAISAAVYLQMETAKEVRQGASATESFRNEMVRISTARPAIVSLGNASPPPLLIEGTD